MTRVFPELRDMTYVPGARLLVDRFEVTDGEFLEFLEATRYQPSSPAGFLSHWRTDPAGRRVPPHPDNPVRFVSLEDARAYARWRGKSIPTRQEWYGFAPGVEFGSFPWPSGGLVERCNVLETGIGNVCPVGVFEGGKSESGCYDLIGNVAEWTETEAAPAEGPPGFVWVLGGSFNRLGLPLETLQPRAKETSARLADWARLGDQTRDRSLADLPAHDLAHHTERSLDVGFRCVLRDAEEVLERALDGVWKLVGAGRRAAVLELKAVGTSREWHIGPPSPRQNRLLPFVAEREFRSRVLWMADVGEVSSLRRSPLSPAGGPQREDLLVLGEGALRQLSGASGEVEWEAAVPAALSARPAHGIVSAGEDLAYYWIESGRGELVLVQLPDGRPHVFPPPAGDAGDEEGWNSVAVSVEAFDRETRTVIAVQSLQEASPDPDSGPRRRVVVRQLLPDAGRDLSLSGDLAFLRPVAPDHLLLGVVEPPGPILNLPSEQLYCIDVQALRITAATRVSAELPDLAVEHPDEVYCTREFVAATAPGPSACLVASVTSAVRYSDLAFPPWDAPPRDVRAEFSLLELPGLQVLDRCRWDSSSAVSVYPSPLPLVYLVEDRRRGPGYVQGRPPRLQTFDLELPGSVAAASHGWWRDDAGEVGAAQPFLVPGADSGEDALDVYEMRFQGEAAALAPLLRGVSLSGIVTQAVLSSQRPRRMVLLTTRDAVGIDLETGAALWQQDLGAEPTSNLGIVAAERDGSSRFLTASSPYELWWRSLETGRREDRVLLRRAALRECVLADVTGDRAREWVVWVDDAAVVQAAQGDRIVALGPPRAEEARLLRDFEAVLAEAGSGEERSP